jgi:hypothetical protein
LNKRRGEERVKRREERGFGGVWGEREEWRKSEKWRE